MMVTGSHIPFDRNGYKTYTSQGELLKEHEFPIMKRVAQFRQKLYNQCSSASPFDASGMFKSGHRELPVESTCATSAYKERYLDFFAGSSLAGMRILVYQHSAVGRDLLADILTALGAEVIPAGRSEEFIPIDTENIDTPLLDMIQKITTNASHIHGLLDAVVSTDGDSDRPLLLSIDRGTDKVCFVGGDLLGMIVSEYLDADAVVVPITCNDGIDRGPLTTKLCPKTRVGSPFVISGMIHACQSGKQHVCGWEANGGFLTASSITRNGRSLGPLPTRDAVLPLLCALFCAHEKKLTLHELFAGLPRRFSRAGLIRQFPRIVSQRILRRYTCTDARIVQVEFDRTKIRTYNGQDKIHAVSANIVEELHAIRNRLSVFFSAERGFNSICKLNYVDGLRIHFQNGDVTHLRPSGNAEELRFYAVADTAERAEQIVSLGINEPGSLLRAMEEAETYRAT